MHTEQHGQAQPDSPRVVTHAKLVRDRIPEIIRAEGSQPVVRTLGPDEYVAQLRRKLGEEVQEYLAAADESDAAAIEELADVLELLYALAATHAANAAALHKRQEHKRAERGAFDERLYLDAVILAAPPAGN